MDRKIHRSMSYDLPLHQMEAQTSLSQDPSIVNYEHEAEIDDSEYQVLWSNIMEKGNYKNSSNYKEVHALLLCWEKHSDDLVIEPEVIRLKSLLNERFKYNAHIEYLDNRDTKRLQVRINRKVASFVDDHDGPNTLLIVYYAGHGRPGRSEGQLELHGQTSPNDKEKRLDHLVWNATEDLLRPAEADILVIFDCCYAGTLASIRGDELRSFEYLAASNEMGSTPVPGDDSFTSALIWALESLVGEKPGGRFTTVELLKKIKEDAPFFSKKQIPVLSDRLHKHGSAGRIMLCPLEGEGSSTPKPEEEAIRSDPAKRQTLTLHFGFDQKPSKEHIQLLGRELNKIFEQNTLGVNGVRWGSMQSTATRVARRFIERIRRASLQRQSKQSLTIHTSRSDEWLSGSVLVPPTPPSTGQLSPSIGQLSPSIGQLSPLTGPLSPQILVSCDTEEYINASISRAELGEAFDEETQD